MLGSFSRAALTCAALASWRSSVVYLKVHAERSLMQAVLSS